MRKHRNPQDSVPIDPSPDNFNPAEALESLHTEIVDIEAFAHAAGEAVTQLPHASTPEDRRVFARVYTLVSRIAEDVAAVVAHGDELIAALSEHQQRRHARARPESGDPGELRLIVRAGEIFPGSEGAGLRSEPRRSLPRSSLDLRTWRRNLRYGTRNP